MTIFSLPFTLCFLNPARSLLEAPKGLRSVGKEKGNGMSNETEVSWESAIKLHWGEAGKRDATVFILTITTQNN